MLPRSRLPPHAVHLETYAELEPYVRAFATGHLNLVLIFGPPGVGKSRCSHHLVGDQACSTDQDPQLPTQARSTPRSAGHASP
jgi:hypothetical protein